MKTLTFKSQRYRINGQLPLFKRLYNWIKFKTLPSSILFKNRLFVERDSKHRRVMSNFGLTFRNSKWSDYAIKNITMTSLTTFTRLIRNIFLSIIFICFVLSYTYYYNYNITYNSLTYVLWSFFEDINYLVAYSFWTVTFTISFLLHMLYNKLFNFVYGTQIVANESSVNNNLIVKTYKPAKNLQSPIFISFLTNPNNAAGNVHMLENLFNQNSFSSSWSTFYKSFKYLYSTNSNLLNINNSSHLNNLTSINSNVNYAPFELTSFTNTPILDSLQNASLNYDYSLTTNLNNQWNLYSFANEVNRYNNLISGKKNLFYLNKLNFNNLNNLITNYAELFSLSQSLLDQTKIVKWNRWLYRYNVLHRKTIKNSHKLTMVKKLISTGFYDTSMMTNNMWNSTFFSKTMKPLLDKTTVDLIHSQFNLLYKDAFNNTQSLSNNFNELNFQSPTSPLNMLRHFEKSYFWFVKRFYLFNTLSTNKITSNIVLEQGNTMPSLSSDVNNTFTKYSLILNSLTRSPNLTNGTLNPTSVFTTFNQNLNDSVTSNLKDLTLVNSDFETFNVDNLEVITNFNNTITTSNADFHFFNINFYTNSINNTNLSFNKKDVSTKSNFITTNSFLNSDTKLLTDMYILMLLNK